METGKRKRGGDVGGGDEGRRGPPRSPASHEAVRAVSEEEVEEFFAILRRMQDATKSLAARTAGGARPRDEKLTLIWRPAFSWEDFDGSNAEKDDNPRGQAAPEEIRLQEKGTTLLLDLNAEPEPEPLGDGVRAGV